MSGLSVQAPCKRCGKAVTLTEEFFNDYMQLPEEVRGDALGAVSHPEGECGEDDPPVTEGLHRYEIHISVLKDTEEVAAFKVEHEAATFTKAIPELAALLEPKWDKLQEAAPIFDLDRAPICAHVAVRGGDHCERCSADLTEG